MLPSQLLSQIDQQCDAYESAFRSGSPRSIEEFIDSAEQELKEPLFTELLGLEIELLVRSGKTPDETEYKEHYPALSDIVEQEFKELNEWLAAQDESNPNLQSNLAETRSLEDSLPDTEKLPQSFVEQQIELPARYEQIRQLGKGGMGVVILARDCELNRQVAIKFPQSALLSDPRAVERFRAEAQAMAQIRHPQVCPIYDIGEVEGQPYLAMAWIEGNTLSHLLSEKGAFEPAEAVRIVRKIALGVQEIHKQGLLHRDLKPANVILQPSGEPVVTDFGLVRELTESNSSLTNSGEVLGSPLYMAPEQANGNRQEISERTDVYALGVTLYQMISGQPPFSGSTMEVIGQLVSGKQPTPLGQLVAVDRSLEKICHKAMSFQSKHRFGSVHELEAALANWSPASTPQRWNRRSLGVSLLLIFVVSLFAIIFNNHRHQPVSIPTAVPSVKPSTEPLPRRPRTELFVDSKLPLGDSHGHAAVAGDFDLDGDLDLITCQWDEDSQIWINEGEQEFVLGQRIPAALSGDVEAGDIDGDGDLDLVIANTGSGSTVWLNDGHAQFELGYTSEHLTTHSIALGDLDGDGDLDLVFGCDNGPNRILENLGSAEFRDSGQRLGLANTSDVQLGDLNGDQHLDLIAVNWDGPNTVWLNDGTGRLTQAATYGLKSHLNGLLFDIDNDDDLDFISTSLSSHCQVWSNDGAGNLFETTPIDSHWHGIGAWVADLDEDGITDLMFSEWNPNQTENNGVWIQYSAFASTPGELIQLETSGNGGEVCVADLNGNGHQDIFIATAFGALDQLFWNQGPFLQKDESPHRGAQVTTRE